jgi:hypothetical protein
VWLPFFRVTHTEFANFSVVREHHAERARVARQIQYEADTYDEYVSPTEAMREAYASPPTLPSAYDLIVLSNFLTEPSMTSAFALELRDLARALTPGGLILTLGGTGGQYPAILERVSEIFLAQRLRKVDGFEQAIQAHPDAARCQHIVDHRSTAMRVLRSACSEDVWSQVPEKLQNIACDGPHFITFPKFRALVYKREGGRR